MPPIFTILFITFIIILTYHLRKNTNAQNEVEERFWNRERESNSIRRKDISNLDYISIPLDKFPMNLHTSSEKKLESLANCKILNLTGYSNTDLKMKYGPANLQLLSECDNHFTELVNVLATYSKELLDANQKEDAKAVLEYAVSICADAKSIYLMLADLYLESGETAQIEELMEKVSTLRTLSKDAIIESLSHKLHNTCP